MSKKLFTKFFVFLLIVGLLFAVAPRQVEAETEELTLDVGTGQTYATLADAIAAVPADLDIVTYVLHSDQSLTATSATAPDLAKGAGTVNLVKADGVASVKLTLDGAYTGKFVALGAQLNFNGLTLANHKANGEGTDPWEFAYLMVDAASVNFNGCTIINGILISIDAVFDDCLFDRQPRYYPNLVDGKDYSLDDYALWIHNFGDVEVKNSTFQNWAYGGIKSTWNMYATGANLSLTLQDNTFVNIGHGGGHTIANLDGAVSVTITGNLVIDSYTGGATTEQAALLEIDQITITPTITVNSNIWATPSVVYVDDGWASVPIGDDPDDAGPAIAMGYDAFATIQEGIAAVGAGGTVNVAAGTYVENVSVDKQVSIIGAGSGTGGTIVTSPVGIDYKVGVFQITGSGVAGSPLLLKDMRIQPVGQAGVSVGRFTEATGQSVSYLSLDNIYVIGTNSNAQTEQERGLYVDLTSTLDHLTVTNSAFNNLAYGWYIQKQVSADISTVSNVQVTNTIFNHNNLKGLYSEKLTDATFTDCTWDQNGFDATGLPSYFIPWMSGVDINLKAGTYQNLKFLNPTITNNALGGAKEGVGITFKARDDGTTYAPFPATLSGVLVDGGTITGNERGIRLGEPGKNNATPTNVTIEDVQLCNNVQHYIGTDGSAYGDIINASQAAVDASPNWFCSATGPADGKVVTTGTGSIDYIPWCANEACTEFTGPVHNITHDTWFATIQGAIDAADAYDKIEVAAGTYAENIVIDLPVTLTGAGRDFVTIQGSNTADNGVFEIKADNVTVDGFTIIGAGNKTVKVTTATSNLTFKNNKVIAATNPLNTNNGWSAFETTYNQSSTNHVITNNIFVGNNSSQLVYYNPQVINLTFTGNSFEGTMVNNMAIGPVLGFDGLDGTQVITGNTFDVKRSGGDFPYSVYALVEAFGTYDLDAIAAANTFKYDGALHEAVVIQNKIRPAYIYNSTNELNKAKLTPGRVGQDSPYVELVSADATTKTITLRFVNPLTSISGFEVRKDGAAPDPLRFPHFNPWLPDYYFSTVWSSTNPITLEKSYIVNDYLEVRRTFGGERDWDFDWTLFELIGDTYADDNWVGLPDGTVVTPDYPFGSSTHIIGYDAFATIQEAIDALTATVGGKVYVQAGTYEELLTIDKPLTLSGPNAGISAGVTPGTRVDEATVTFPAGLTADENYLVTITSDNVTIDGLNFTYQEYLIGLYPVLISAEGVDNLKVVNNKFFGGEMAVEFYPSDSQPYSVGLLIENNYVDCGPFVNSRYNRGFYIYSTGGVVKNNVVLNTSIGIQILPHREPTGGTVEGNVVSAYSIGLYQNNHWADSGAWSWKDNTVTMAFNDRLELKDQVLLPYTADVTFRGVHLINYGIYGGTVPPVATFEGNSIDGASVGSVGVVGVDAIRINSTDSPFVPGTTATFRENSFINYTTAINNIAYASTSVIVDAKENWWGSPCGPAPIIGTATVSPWYMDAAKTSLSDAPASGSYVFPAGTPTAEINATIACAANGSTFTFETGGFAGGIEVHAPKEHMTLVLKDYAVVTATSPCFDVSADYTTIMAENIGMAFCYTAAGSNGIDVADNIRNLTVDGLEIYGPGNDGIHFAGVIRDVVLKDNFIHDLAGNGVYFGAQPVELTPGGIDIHGNLFENNDGNGIEAGAFTVPAKYNSWGNEGGPAGTTNLIPGVIYAGDGISSGVDASPWTHVDVYLVASGTPWTDLPLNQVVSDQTITFKVMAHVVNALTVDVKLAYPTNLTEAVTSATTSAFPALSVFDTTTPNVINFYGMGPDDPDTTEIDYQPVTGDVELFTVTFKGTTPELDLAMEVYGFKEVFGMAGVGSSSNIYAVALLDSTVNVIALPVIDIVPVVPQPGPYTAGLPIEFNITVTNAGGGNFTDLNLDFTLPTGAVLQYWDGDSWETVIDPMTIGDLATGGTAFDPILPLFRVIFAEPPTGTISVGLVDVTTGIVPTTGYTGYLLAATSETFDLLGNFTITGTFSMQGRSTRAGIPVTLDYQDLVAYTDKTGTTINQISYNLVIPEVNGGHWLLTTNQARYLNVIAANSKIFMVDGDETLNALQLLGGNAVWENDNIIDVNDASQVGTDYGNPLGVADPSTLAGDCNFDGKINVQDLALVGGNYGKTSVLAYGVGSDIWLIQ